MLSMLIPLKVVVLTMTIHVDNVDLIMLTMLPSHRRCSSSHNSLRGIHSITHSIQSNSLLRSAPANPNSALALPNKIYKHACHCLSSVKQFE